MNILKDFIRDESGATAVEYGLLAALIGVGIIAAAKGAGSAVNNNYDSWTNDFETAVS